MQFVFPLFLGALATLAIPVIIHLFYFRRFKKVYFTNVRFLKEVKEETSNRQKLRNLLVLLMRSMAIIFLVLAFAQPFLPRNEGVRRGDKAVSVYIDNSFSMAALAKDAPLLELARQRARDIVAAYAVGDRFQVLTNDFEGRDQRLVSREDALNRIEEIRISPATRDLSRVLSRQQQCLNTGKAENQVAYVISDFQQSIANLDDFRDTALEVHLVPMRAVQESNISIDSAWFESPVQILNQPARLLVQISNRSDEDAEEVRLSFQHAGQVKPVGSINIPARSTRLDSVSFTILNPGWHEVKLSISDYPVQFDDDYYLTFQVARQINVLAINGKQPNPYLNNAFRGAGYFRLTNADMRSLDYSRFSEYELILLQELDVVSSGLTQELRTFVQNGGNALVFPSKNADLSSYNALLQSVDGGEMSGFDPTPRQASQINTEEFVFRDVFLNNNSNLRLPSTQGNFRLAANRGEPILSYRDGSALLTKYPLGEGALYFMAAPLNEDVNDLVRNAEIFVPMLFKMAIAGTRSGQIAYTIGKDEVLEAKHQPAASSETLYKLSLLNPVKSAPSDDDPTLAAEDGSEFIPEQRILGSKVLLTPGRQVQEAGWYQLKQSADSTLATYAFNFDRRESELRYRSDEDLQAQLRSNVHLLSEREETNFAQIVDEQNQGVTLWRWCIVFALLFLALEGLFLRLWKV